MYTPGVDWDDLRYILAIYQAGSLNKAAEQLGVARPTVGRRLKSLEDSLGVRLFDRSSEGFLATDVGEEAAALAERMEAEVHSFEAKATGRDHLLSGKLVVSTMEPILECFHEDFTRFMKNYPEVALTISTTLSEVSLHRREADIALRLNNTPPESLIGQKVGWVAFAPYASKALIEAVGTEAPLRNYPWLHWDERQNAQWFDHWLDQHAPGAKIALRLSELNSLRTAVRAGIGAQILPCFDGDMSKELSRIGPPIPNMGRDLWLLTLPDLRRNSRVKAFMKHMKTALQSRRAILQGAS